MWNENNKRKKGTNHMKSEKRKGQLSNYSKIQLIIFWIIFLLLGIIMFISGCLYALVSLPSGLFIIAIGIALVCYSRKYKSELTKRKSIQSHISSDTSTSKLFANSDNNISIKKEHHNIAGTSYRQKEIMSLGIENCNYSMKKNELMEEYNENEKIYQIEFFPRSVELVEEPNNIYDPNAIKVIIDDVHVGYIKKGSCSHIKKLIRENRICKITPDIHGGKYKRILCIYDYEKDKDVYKLETDETDFFVSITLDIKPE